MPEVIFSTAQDAPRATAGTHVTDGAWHKSGVAEHRLVAHSHPSAAAVPATLNTKVTTASSTAETRVKASIAEAPERRLRLQSRTRSLRAPEPNSNGNTRYAERRSMMPS